MNVPDFGELKLVKLKDRLRARGFKTSGLKVELVRRLEEAQSHSVEVMTSVNKDGTPHTSNDVNENSETESRVNPAENVTTNAIDLMRRENEIMQRELDLARRQIEFLSMTQSQGQTQSTRPLTTETAEVVKATVERRLGIREIGELLGDFCGAR
ncbi:hypothetical protein KM043_017591 [Ampulex compressa]|nr:hypothetical protein KM043_017591 [Ampulex compressa]